MVPSQYILGKYLYLFEEDTDRDHKVKLTLTSLDGEQNKQTCLCPPLVPNGGRIYIVNWKKNTV